MVRRDTTGQLTPAVEDSLQGGRELLDCARAIEDEAAFERWRKAKTQWTRHTARMLTLRFEPETVQEFIRANDTLGETWEQLLRAELAAMRNAIDLLRMLRSTLRG